MSNSTPILGVEYLQRYTITMTYQHTFIAIGRIKSALLDIHPLFQIEAGFKHQTELVFKAPTRFDTHVFVLVHTGIDITYKKTSFLAIRLYDFGIQDYIGVKFIVKIGNNWEIELKKVILHLAQNIKDFICDRCGNYLVIRKGKDEEFFLGCYSYPTCNATKQIKPLT